MMKVVVTWVLSMVTSISLGSEAPLRSDLQIGDPAPRLDVARWLKGSPVKDFEPGHVYLIEFWSTWCGPCLQQLPHLNELAKKYPDQLTIIGVNTLESRVSPDVDPEDVQRFVDKKGDKMGYPIAMDDPAKDSTFHKWVTAAGLAGIPKSAIVDRQGRLAWIGHPNELDDPLEQIIDGTFDLALAREVQVAEREKALEYEKREKRLKKITSAFSRRNYAAARAAANEYVQLNPGGEVKDFWVVLRAFLLADATQGIEYIQRKSEDAEFLNAMGYSGSQANNAFLDTAAQVIARQADFPTEAYEFASQRLERMVAKQATFIREDALAQARAGMGDLAAAVTGEEKALVLLEKTGDKKVIEMWSDQIWDRLSRYRDEMAKQQTGNSKR